MKKVLIIIIIIIPVAIFLCTSVYFISKNQIDFNNQIKCYGFKNQLQKNIDEYNNKQNPEERTTNNGTVEKHICYEQKELGEIFYSHKLNSCLNMEILRTICKSLMPDASGNYGVNYESYYLINTLSNQEINFNKGSNSFYTIQRSEQFDSKKNLDTIINGYR